MSDTSAKPSKLSGLTVTCHQCGGASMTRLDRKEYRCTHCGAITIISDDDAERVEKMLANALKGARSSGYPQAVSRAGIIVCVAVFVVAVAFAFITSLTTHRRSSTGTSVMRDASTVPASQVVLSPLRWEPDSSMGGHYVGLLYNHSGYVIDAPSYNMTLFHNGMKGDRGIFRGMLRTLQPGEYEHVTFRTFNSSTGDRYEIENSSPIRTSTAELAPAKLLNPQFVHLQGSERYILVGVVQNTFTRPISGVGQLLLYDKDQQIIAAASDSFSEIRPGEKTMLSMSAWTTKPDVPIAAYEYLIDAQFADSR